VDRRVPELPEAGDAELSGDAKDRIPLRVSDL